jgi:hypothetical protein
MSSHVFSQDMFANFNVKEPLFTSPRPLQTETDNERNVDSPFAFAAESASSSGENTPPPRGSSFAAEASLSASFPLPPFPTPLNPGVTGDSIPHPISILEGDGDIKSEVATHKMDVLLPKSANLPPGASIPTTPKKMTATPEMTPTQKRVILRREAKLNKAAEEEARGYLAKKVERLCTEQNAQIGGLGRAVDSANGATSKTLPILPFPQHRTNLNLTVEHEGTKAKATSDIVPFPKFEGLPMSFSRAALSDEEIDRNQSKPVSTSGEALQTAAPNATPAPEGGQPDAGLTVDTSANDYAGSILFTDAHSPTIMVTPGTETEGSDTREDDEAEEPNKIEGADDLQGEEEEEEEVDREHLTHFKSWGRPAARPQPSKCLHAVAADGLTFSRISCPNDHPQRSTACCRLDTCSVTVSRWLD